MYYLFFENTLSFKCTSFTDVMKMIIAAHFTFNKDFPKRHSMTFDFIQRCFVDIQPTGSSKVSNPSKSKTKVMSFITKINKLLKTASAENEFQAEYFEATAGP